MIFDLYWSWSSNESIFGRPPLPCWAWAATGCRCTSGHGAPSCIEGDVASVRPNLVPCFNLVLPSLEPPAHTLRALESCWHAGEGLPCCPVTSSGSYSAANGRADEEYQVRARYQVRANPLLFPIFDTCTCTEICVCYHRYLEFTRLRTG